MSTRATSPRTPVSLRAGDPGDAAEPARRTRPARPAGPASRPPGRRTGPADSIGAVGLPGKSRFSASVTTRGAAPAGSTVASVPPQVTRRNGEPSASSTTTIGTAYSTGRRITLRASRYQAPWPSATGGPAHRPADPQRVHLRAEHGQQRGHDGQRGEHVHQDGGHPAVAHRAQERLGEQHQAGQGHRDRDAGDRARCGRRWPRSAPPRPATDALAVQFLAEPADHEQAVVDGQAEAEDRGDVDRVDRHRGDQGQQPQRGERAEDRDAADGQRQAGRGQAAEDDQHQDQQHRQREALGPADVRGDLLVDRLVGRDLAADLGAQTGRAEPALDRVVVRPAARRRCPRPARARRRFPGRWR